MKPCTDSGSDTSNYYHLFGYSTPGQYLTKSDCSNDANDASITAIRNLNLAIGSVCGFLVLAMSIQMHIAYLDLKNKNPTRTKTFFQGIKNFMVFRSGLFG